ncbi:metallophosphoesterase [bacterium]|nr:metallophosphoesterase [bacterium]
MSIKLAVISDVHFGDQSSAMALKRPGSTSPTLGSRYVDFRDAVKATFNGEPLDYLVLLGDIFDFSIAQYRVAYETGAVFFRQIVADGLIKQYKTKSGQKNFGSIIYISGNHDFDMWHTVEYQANIINRMNRRLPVYPLKMSLPACIDDRPGSPLYGFTLPHVSSNAAGLPKYGGLFLDHIIQDNLYFSFGFPNLYLVTENETVMMSHGQYLDSTWSCLGKWGLEILKDDLRMLKDPDRLNLAEMVGMNLPTSQLLCSSVGQAGPLTEVVMTIENAVKAKNKELLNKYLRRVKKMLKRDRGIFSRWIMDAAFGYGKKQLYKALFGMQSARDNADYIRDKGVRSRLKDFYDSTLSELEGLAADFSVTIPQPSRLIFGHTHQPVSWNQPDDTEISLPGGGTLKLSNTGGWMHRITGNGVAFCGAEIFFYETGSGMSSVRIT